MIRGVAAFYDTDLNKPPALICNGTESKISEEMGH